MGKSLCVCTHRQNLANIVITNYTDKIRNLPRGMAISLLSSYFFTLFYTLRFISVYELL